jgi:hypothetical protein
MLNGVRIWGPNAVATKNGFDVRVWAPNGVASYKIRQPLVGVWEIIWIWVQTKYRVEPPPPLEGLDAPGPGVSREVGGIGL